MELGPCLIQKVLVVLVYMVSTFLRGTVFADVLFFSAGGSLSIVFDSNPKQTSMPNSLFFFFFQTGDYNLTD